MESDLTTVTPMRRPAHSGQTISMSYNPQNPDQASTIGARQTSLAFWAIALALFVAGLGIAGWVLAKRRKTSLLQVSTA